MSEPASCIETDVGGETLAVYRDDNGQVLMVCECYQRAGYLRVFHREIWDPRKGHPAPERAAKAVFQTHVREP